MRDRQEVLALAIGTNVSLIPKVQN